MIVVGERRWRAAMQAGMTHIDCIVRYDLDEQRARELQCTENYQREDIPPLQQARSFKAYLEEYKVSQSELSRRTGIPQRTISHRLALLTLPSSLQARVEAGEIGPYEAERIAALPADQQEAVAEAVSAERMGGRDLEKQLQPRKSSHMNDRLPQETPETVDVLKADISLSQRLDNLEKALYDLAATYAFNESAKQRTQGIRKAPPCPECAKRGDRGIIWDMKRKVTPKDRIEMIESIEAAEELTEEERKELLEEPVPTHMVEAKCQECGYEQLIEYVWE